MVDTNSINVMKTTNTYSYELTGHMNNKNLSNIGAGSTGPNYMLFTGITGDANGFHSVISERSYDAVNESSELFIGKAKESRLTPTLGPDRIRLTAP